MNEKDPISRKRAEKEKVSFSAQTFKYWEIFLSWLFKYPSRCYALSNEDPHTCQNPSDLFHQFGKSYRMRSASKGIICRVTYEDKDVEQVASILKHLKEEMFSPTFSELAAAEVLAKVVAYRDLKKGQEIPIPIRNKKGEITLASYKVDTVFDLWSKVRAFGLTGSFDEAPILLFRGTDFSLASEGGRASIVNDLDPKGPGRTLFEKANDKIVEWLEEVNKTYGPARLIGHSLGGAFVTYTLVDNFPYISKKSHEASFAFNFPGIAKDLLEKWKKIPVRKKPHFKGVVSRGDFVSKFGYLFGEVYELSLSYPLSPIRAHEMLFLSELSSDLHRVDTQTENTSPSRQFYSKLQEQTASIIYQFGLKFFFPN